MEPMENTKLLHSRRLVLRKFRQEDENEELKFLEHKNFKYFKEKTIEDKKEFIQKTLENYENKENYNQWHIVKIGENISIGMAKAKIEEDAVEIKIIIAEKFENRGYATESLNAIIHEFLTGFEITKVKLKAQNENNSWKEVISKVYFKEVEKDDNYTYYEMNNMDYMKIFAIYGDI